MRDSSEYATQTKSVRPPGPISNIWKTVENSSAKDYKASSRNQDIRSSMPAPKSNRVEDSRADIHRNRQESAKSAMKIRDTNNGPG